MSLLMRPIVVLQLLLLAYAVPGGAHMSTPALVALSAVVVLAALLAVVVMVRRRRCAQLCSRFAAAATSGKFDEADRIASSWFDATPWTGLRRSAVWTDRLAHLPLRPRRSRAGLRSPSRPDVRRRSVS